MPFPFSVFERRFHLNKEPLDEMVDSGRATDPPASVPTFIALSRFTGPSVPDCRTGAGVAACLVLDMSCPAASCLSGAAAG